MAASRNSFNGRLSWVREGISLSPVRNLPWPLHPKKAREEPQEKGSGSPPEFTREQELTALRDMLLIRRFEEKAGQLYGMGAIGGFCHLYIGQEAVVVGMQMALKEGDQVITGYRDHGHMLATGHGRQGRDGRADRPPRRLFQGQGRLDAHVQQGEEFLRRPRHRRRAGVARHRPGLRQPLSRQRQRLPRLFRRRRGQSGPGL